MPDAGAKQREKKRRKRPIIRDVKMEVAGPFGDPIHAKMVNVMRAYRERYFPLMRHFVISTPPKPTNTSNGDNRTRRSKFTVTVDGIDIQQLSGRTPPPTMDQADLSPTDLLHFLQDDFVGVKLTTLHPRHRIAASEALTAAQAEEEEEGQTKSTTPSAATVALTSSIHGNQLVVKQYFHESLRFSSFLIGVKGGNAVMVDALLSVEKEMEANAKRLGMTVVSRVQLTYYFDALTTNIKSAQGGACIAPKTCQKPTQQVDLGTISYTSLVGSQSYENVQVSLVLDASHTTEEFPFLSAALRVGDKSTNKDNIVALFCGDLMGVDCVGRVDLTRIANVFATLAAGEKPSIETAGGPAQDQTKTILSMLHQEGVSDETILFPAHGNYNDVTRSLDLHWALHVGDLKKQQHTKPLMDVLCGDREKAAALGADGHDELHHVFSKNRSVSYDKLPFHHSWMVNYVHNKDGVVPQLLANPDAAGWGYVEHARRRVQGPRQEFAKIERPSEEEAKNQEEDPLWIDIRPWTIFRNDTLVNQEGRVVAVNVPMEEGHDELGAKKAEVWLTALLQHSYRSANKSVSCVCSPDQVVFLDYRLRTIGLHCSKKIVRENPTGCDEDAHDFSSRNNLFTTRRLETHSDLLVLDRCITSTTAPSASSSSSGDLSIIVDIRTAFEHRNGAHRNAIHWPLADMISVLTNPLCKDLRNKITSSNHAFIAYMVSLATEQGLPVREDLHEIEEAQRVKEVIFYCAAGYRSHIAVSLFMHVFGDDNSRVSFQCSDLMGGALQIMTQRPDLWQVKDRSILCIS